MLRGAGGSQKECDPVRSRRVLSLRRGARILSGADVPKETRIGRLPARFSTRAAPWSSSRAFVFSACSWVFSRGASLSLRRSWVFFARSVAPPVVILVLLALRIGFHAVIVEGGSKGTRSFGAASGLLVMVVDLLDEKREGRSMRIASLRGADSGPS
jgi:hypothetical protein